jgi:hypothetical protein
MSIVEEFQLKIYETLKNNNSLNALVQNIYYAFPQDKEYPFIYLNYTNITKTMFHNISRFQIKLEALLFIKGFNPKTSNDIIEELKNAMMFPNINLNLAEIISIQNQDIEYQKANDLITHKITSHFIITLQEKIV